MMDLSPYLFSENEQPLDRIVSDGGFCGIFRTIACIGDSLSSGEFESTDPNGWQGKGYHDYFEYSWGQYLARAAGLKVLNFSRGGMTASEYCENFAEANGFWDPEKACQAYIIALGVNDLLNGKQDVGSLDDVDFDDYTKNKKNFAGYYTAIIQRYRQIQPKSRMFLMTMPRSVWDDEAEERKKKHAEFLYQLAEKLPFTYVIDLNKYGPLYDERFAKRFYLGGHLNAAGYLLTGKMVASYIDYIIRKNPDDFTQTGFIGTPFHNEDAKW